MPSRPPKLRPDLAELLARVAGLQLRRFGGLGAPAVPSIRGSSPAQVRLLVDGLPLDDAQTGTFDLTLLPIERFAAADVYRGLVPAEFGGVGGAGAIDLITRGVPPRGYDLRLFTGSFGDLGGRLTVGSTAADGRRSLLATVHGRRIDNRYWFTDHNQTFHDPTDDVRRQRENAQWREWGAFVRGDLAVGSLTGMVNAGHFRRDGGRPGPLGYTSEHATVRHQRTDARLRLARADGKLALDVAGDRVEQILYDPLGEVGFDPPGDTRSLSHDLYARLVAGPVADLATFGSWLPDGSIRLRLGADARGQWYRQWFGDDSEPERRRTVVSAFAGLALDFYRLRLLVAPALRWQRVEDNFPPVPALPWLPELPAVRHVQEDASPSLAAVWEALPGRVIVEGRIARSVRQPTWIELFGYRGGVDGNRELAPERINSWDVGARVKLAAGAWQLRAALFGLQTDATIIFVQNSQRTSKAFNFGRTTNLGVEIEAFGRLPGGGQWLGNVTWQDPRDAGLDPAYHGKELPFLPPLQAFARLSPAWGRWRPFVAVTYLSANYRDRYNHPIDRAPARTVANLGLSYQWIGGLGGRRRETTVTAEAINITGNDVYDVEGFPLPGRSYRLSLSWR